MFFITKIWDFCSQNKLCNTLKKKSHYFNFRLFAASSLGYFDSLTQLDVDAVSWLHKKRK